MPQRMNNNEIVAKLNSDWRFGVNFIIDNNPDGVQANLTSIGLDIPDNPTKLVLRQFVNQLIEEGKGQQAIEVLTTPYQDNTKNYTGGLEPTLKRLQGTSNAPDLTQVAQARSTGGNPEDRSATALAIIGLIGTIGGGILSNAGQKQQLELEAERQETLRLQQEMMASKKVLGLPQNVFFALLGLVAVVLIVVAIRK